MFFNFTPQQLSSWDWYFKFSPDNTIIWTEPFNHYFPWASIALYLLMLYTIPKIFTKGFKFVEKVIFPLWNLFLWILSVAMLVGSIHSIYDYILVIKQTSPTGTVTPHDLLCDSRIVNDPHMIVFWTYIFALSKYVELFDTFWSLLKNPEKPVDLLHWWHHTSVLLFTWYAIMWKFGAGLFFLSMNSLIHAFMYLYYFLTSVGYRPTWAKWLTMAQISQMIVGTFINVYWIYLYINGIPCSCQNPNLLLWACGIMYGSYLYLFCDFYFKKYNTKSDKKKQ